MSCRYPFLLLALVLCACGGGRVFHCDDPPLCPGDTPSSASDVAACQAALQDSCGQAFSALGACGESHAHCDQNGKSIVEATLCEGEFTTMLSCCRDHPGTKGCG